MHKIRAAGGTAQPNICSGHPEAARKREDAMQRRSATRERAALPHEVWRVRCYSTIAYMLRLVWEDLYMNRYQWLDSVVGAVSCHTVGLGVCPPSDDVL